MVHGIQPELDSILGISIVLEILLQVVILNSRVDGYRITGEVQIDIVIVCTVNERSVREHLVAEQVIPPNGTGCISPIDAKDVA